MDDIIDKFKEGLKKVKETVPDDLLKKGAEKVIEATTGINVPETINTIKSIVDVARESNPEKIDYKIQGFEDSKRHGGTPDILETNLEAIDSILLSHYGKVSADKTAEITKVNEKIENLKKEKDDIPNKIITLENDKKENVNKFENDKKSVIEDFDKEKENISQKFEKDKQTIVENKEEEKKALQEEKKDLQNQYIEEKNRTEKDYNERIAPYKQTIKEVEEKIKTLGTNITNSISLEFVIEGALLLLITFFLFIFYSSVVNSALFKTFVLTENSEIDKLIISSIFDPEDLSNATGMQFVYLCSAPAVFLTLGFVLHLCLNFEKKVKKWLSSSAVVILAFIFDGLLAFSVSKKIFDMTSPLKFGVHETYCFYTDINFGVTIFFGFVVYIFWGILFSAFVKAWNPDYKKLKNQIDITEERIKKVEEDKKNKIENLENEYYGKEGKISKKKEQINNIEDSYKTKFEKIEEDKKEAEKNNQTERDENINKLEADKNSKMSEIDEKIRDFKIRLEEIPEEIEKNSRIIADNGYKELQPETEHFFADYYAGWHEWIHANVSDESKKDGLELYYKRAYDRFSGKIKSKYKWGANK